jgi:NADH-quinone oxidoreductase subunit L
VTVPLVLLAIPSLVIGYLTIEPVLFGGWLADSIVVHPQNDVLAVLGQKFHGAWAMAVHGLVTAPFWLMIAGLVLATLIYRIRPTLAQRLRDGMPGLYRLLLNKYYWDEFYQAVFVRRVVQLGRSLWERADAGLIDGVLVNGSARLVGSLAQRVRLWQSGYLFQYAFAMIIGLIGILTLWVVLG